MSFSAFVIVCVFALVGYYIFLALKPEKKGFSYEDNDSDFDSAEIVVDPPITVTLGMVTFSPTVPETSDNTTPPKSDTNADMTAKNRYNHSTVVNGSSLEKAEISAFYTKDAIKEGETLFSNIFMQQIK